MQKKLFAATLAAAIGVGGNAFAADVYSAGGSKDAPVYVASGSWVGFYIGADLGGMINDNDLKARFFAREKDGDTWSTSRWFSLHDNGNKDEPIGGVHIGYNFQSGNLVYGIEGDVNFADNIDYLATIRGRLGYAMNSWLIYGTGGAAFISFDNDSTVTSVHGTSWTFRDNRTETGWVAGGGIEKKITPNISFGVEGLFYSFDNHSVTHLLKQNYCFSDFADISRDQEFWTVRARLTYHFPVSGDYVPLK